MGNEHWNLQRDMSQQLTGKGMEEKVTLSVYKNSPHIWTGGLEGEDLAKWLIGKANAIRYAIVMQAKASQYSDLLRELKNSEPLREAYVSLGLSHKDTDPILPQSEGAIQFDMEIAEFVLTHKQCAGDIAVPPLEYSHLPDLAEEKAEFHLKKAAISAENSSQFLGKENE